ncbi:MAG: hypothetical protein ACFBSF_19390 [Leptolyngbyaceae cyanobacterium]
MSELTYPTKGISRNEYSAVGWRRGTRPNTSSIAILLGFTSFNPAYTGNFSGNFLLGDLLKSYLNDRADAALQRVLRSPLASKVI